MSAGNAVARDTHLNQAAFRRWLARRPASDQSHYELLDGRIVMTPPAGWPHGRIGSRLNHLLADHVERHSLGIVLDSSAGYDLPTGDTVEPDVSFISTECLAAGPRPTRGRFITLVPTLIVEILSPSTSRRDRTQKKAIYERNGVAEYWLVDPAKESVTVFALQRGRYTRARPLAAGSIPSRALPRMRIRIEQIFDLGL
ncbi:MAG: Uma2 family endonuclease [Candidatus Binatia bacterium]